MNKVKCQKCGQPFSTTRGLHIHTTRMHPYVYTPPPQPEKKHVNYRDLVKDSHETWGQEMTKEKEKHPQIEQLQIGALFEIVHLLHELIAEIKRPR